MGRVKNLIKIIKNLIKKLAVSSLSQKAALIITMN